MDLNTIPPVLPNADPIDQYLSVLQQTKNYFDTQLPNLSQGVSQILDTSVGRGVPNGIPMNPAIDNALGSNRGLPSFTPQPLKANPNGTQDLVKDTIASLSIPGVIPEPDALHKVRKVGFAAGPEKYNFDRYYNHPSFKNLGWNPFADNETIYNQNSTWSDDFSRAMSVYPSLVGLGFSQTLNNWDDLFSLNTAGDTKNAREMNRLMSIASSSRGGLGGFAVNQVANSAYTIGVLLEIATEELALFGATAATEGAMGIPAIARTGQNLKRLFNLGKAADIAGDAAKASKIASQTVSQASTGTALNSIQDISQARKFWNGVGNFLNPFNETVEAVKNFRTGANGFDKMTDFAKNAKVFGAFYRDLRLMNTTLAESRLEGGFVQNETFDKLMAEYYKNNVEPPDDETANKILTQAKLAGQSTTIANIPAILYSNKIVFEKALNGFSPFREVGKKGSLGTMTSKTVKKDGKKMTLYEGFIDTANPRTWFTKQGLKHFGRQFLPKNLAKSGVRYMATNITEGAQEVYQEAIAETMKNYYLDTYFSPERAGLGVGLSHLAQGFGGQIGGKGAETFLSGFLMGGLVQIPQTVAFQTLPQVVTDFRNRYKDPVKYKQSIDERKKQQQSITDFLNSVAADPKTAYDKIYENFKAQKDFSDLMNDAENEGDKKTHEDTKQDSLFTHVSNLIERGYLDLFTNQVDSFKQLSDKELLEAFGYSERDGNADELNKSMRQRLDGINDKVKEIQKRYDKYSTIRNPFNKEGDIAEKLDYDGFEAARKTAIYSEYSFEKAKGRMASILQKASTFMPGIEAGRITSLFVEDQYNEQLNILQREIKAYEGGTPEELKIQKEKQEQYDALVKLKGALDTYLDSYQKAKKGFNKERVKEAQQDEKVSKEINEGTEVEYTTQKKEKIKGKVIKKEGKKATIEYTQNGKTKKKIVSIDSKSLRPVGMTDAQLEIPFDEETLVRILNEDKDNVEIELRKYLSKLTGLEANDVRMDSLVIDYLDYYALEDDSKSFMSLVNALNDPGYFSRVGQMHSKAMNDALAIAQRKLQESLEEYKRRMATNDIARELFYKFHVFFDPEEMMALQKGEKFPTVFYDVNTKKPIDQRSGKYKDIVDYLIDFEEVNQFDLKGKPIVGEEESIVGPYVTNTGPTLKKLMTDLGLDPKSKELQTIKLTDLLRYVITNKIGPPSSWRLAQILIDKVSPDEEVSINLNEPQAFTYSKDSGIVIDPRYAASDYDETQLSFEYMVLAPLLQKIVSDNTGDAAFTKALNDAITAVKENFEVVKNSLPEEQRILYSTMTSSKEAFVTLALTLGKAQEILESIPYKNTTKNLWEQLLDDILKLISKFIGRATEKETVMTEVLGIISNKIEGGPSMPVSERVDFRPETPVELSVITPDTSIDDMPEELQKELQYAFQVYQQSNPSVPDSDIGKFVKQTEEAARVIQRWNINNGLIQPEEITPVAKPKPEKVTEVKEINFENLVPGSILRMKDAEKYPLRKSATVVSSDPQNRTVTVKPTNQDVIFVIEEKDLVNEIEKILKTPDQAVEPVEEVNITSEEKDLSNQDVDATLTEELLGEIKKDADASTKEESDDDFLKDLECK